METQEKGLQQYAGLHIMSCVIVFETYSRDAGTCSEYSRMRREWASLRNRRNRDDHWQATRGHQVLKEDRLLERVGLRPALCLSFPLAGEAYRAQSVGFHISARGLRDANFMPWVLLLDACLCAWILMYMIVDAAHASLQHCFFSCPRFVLIPRLID